MERTHNSAHSQNSVISVISLQALDFRMSLIFWRDKLWPQSLAEIGLPHVAISSGPFLWVIAIRARRANRHLRRLPGWTYA